VVNRVGFFCDVFFATGRVVGLKRGFMTEFETSIARQVAQAAVTCHLDRTGQAPDSVAVVLSGDTLVVTLHGALSLAERTMAKTEAGAAKVQEFHGQLFSNSLDPFCKQVKEILGTEVLEAKAVVDPGTGTVMQVFTKGTGTMVQMFLLDGKVAAGAWSGAAGRN
jgi:uncharacterized protein YbcI